MLSVYYLARRETDSDKIITESKFKEFLQKIVYEHDIALIVLKRLDDLYLKLIHEKQKREIDRLKK